MNHRSNKSSCPSKILHFLFQGKAPKKSDYGAITSVGITSVINCTNHIENVFENCGFSYLRVPLEDSADSNISEYFEMCNNFIDDNKDNGSILVHCAGGVSRSSAIVLAYLVGRKNYTLQKAFELLKDKRAVACPRDEFKQQLMNYEKSIHGRVTVEIKPKINKKNKKKKKQRIG